LSSLFDDGAVKDGYAAILSAWDSLGSPDDAEDDLTLPSDADDIAPIIVTEALGPLDQRGPEAISPRYHSTNSAAEDSAVT
jgi:hypothetical protein